MAVPNVISSIFHEIKGDNVQLEEDRAKWNPVVNGAFAFSKKPLRVGVSLTLEIEGSGRVSLGTIQIDPLLLKNRLLYSLNDISEYSQINEVRVHRRNCSIKYIRESEGRRVVAIYNNERFTQNIGPEKDVWLAVYVKFGEVTLRLKSEEADDMILSEVIGMNLEFSANGINEVKTVSPNPAAICFIGQPLNISQKISFFCEPLKDSRGEPPSRFYLKINVTDKTPKQLQQQHKNLFTISNTSQFLPQWVCTRVMDRENCNGQVTIERIADHIVIANGMDERTRINISVDQETELWVMLDLYRVLLRQVEICFVPMDTADLGYITAASPCQQPPQRSVSVASYSVVTGNEDYQEDSIPQTQVTLISPGIDPIDPADDYVRFETSFNGHFADLVKDLSGLELCDHLISLQVITISDLERINNRETARSQNRELLCLLVRKPVPKLKFIAALEDSGNRHLIKKFFPEL